MLADDNASLQDMIFGLRFILDQIGTYIFTKDKVGRYTYVNQMVQKRFGVSYEDFIEGMTVISLIWNMRMTCG
jgi:PAS domain-containing protein